MTVILTDYYLNRLIIYVEKYDKVLLRYYFMYNYDKWKKKTLNQLLH
jgi:hypothetical protein